MPSFRVDFHLWLRHSTGLQCPCLCFLTQNPEGSVACWRGSAAPLHISHGQATLKTPPTSWPSLVLQSKTSPKQTNNRNTTSEIYVYTSNFLFSGEDKDQARCNELFWYSTISFLSKDFTINNCMLAPLPGTPALLCLPLPPAKMSCAGHPKVRRLQLFLIKQIRGFY